MAKIVSTKIEEAEHIQKSVSITDGYNMIEVITTKDFIRIECYEDVDSREETNAFCMTLSYEDADKWGEAMGKFFSKTDFSPKGNKEKDLKRT